MGIPATVKVGCCGFQVSRKRYYEKLKLVEVQKTFYKPPKIETVRKWRKEAPGDFEFTVKAWMAFTHDPRSGIWAKTGLPKDDSYGLLRPSRENFSLWDEFRVLLRELGTNVVVFQSPPSFRFDEVNLANAREFFSTISGEFTFAWEVREAGWFKSPQFRDLLEDLGISHVVDPMYEEPVYGKIRYYRLHGRREGKRIIYSHNYERTELERLKELVERWSLRENYVLFNNSYFSFENAVQFQELLHSM